MGMRTSCSHCLSVTIHCNDRLAISVNLTMCSCACHVSILEAWQLARGYICTIPMKRSNAGWFFDHLNTVKCFHTSEVCIPKKFKKSGLSNSNSFIVKTVAGAVACVRDLPQSACAIDHYWFCFLKHGKRQKLGQNMWVTDWLIETQTDK